MGLLLAHAEASTAARIEDQPHHARTQLLWRLVFAFAAVLVCYQFQWSWLKSLTLELNSRLDAMAGVHLQRVSGDTVTLNGSLFRYVIACTFADVWCAALPLMWRLRRSALRNLAAIAVFSAALLLLNVVRLSLGDVLYARGVPWSFAEGIPGGIAYFVVLLFLVYRRAWSEGT